MMQGGGSPALLRTFIAREIQGSIKGSNLGWFWLVLSPVLLLMVYTLVFGVVFQARVPEGLSVPFVAWLGVALWPWLAFSDGILRASGSLVRHGAILSKVPIPALVFPIASQTSAFLLHSLGYAVILLVLYVVGVPIAPLALPYVVLLLLSLYLFSLGFSILIASLQVFIRDVELLLPTFLMLWFFLTPILYPPDLLPDPARSWLALNPMAWWMAEFRAAVLEGKAAPDGTFAGLVLVAVCMPLLARAFFYRVEPHFKDFM